MSYDSNAAANHVPIFGGPGTITPEGEGDARTWDLSSIAVADGSDLAEHRDANGMIVARTHFNGDGSGNVVNRSRTITITAAPVGSDAAAALSDGALLKRGMTFTVAGSTVPGANGLWECTGCQANGTNVDHVTITITGVWSVTNA